MVSVNILHYSGHIKHTAWIWDTKMCKSLSVLLLVYTPAEGAHTQHQPTRRVRLSISAGSK